MKKFKFSLDSVLSYKQQVLDALKGEHAAILAEVRAQEDVVEAAWRAYRDRQAGRPAEERGEKAPGGGGRQDRHLLH